MMYEYDETGAQMHPIIHCFFTTIMEVYDGF